jgi:hypothetical protein
MNPIRWYRERQAAKREAEAKAERERLASHYVARRGGSPIERVPRYRGPVGVVEPPKRDEDGSFGTSMAVGAATGNAFLGAAIGGSITGGLLGASMTDPGPSYSSDSGSCSSSDSGSYDSGGSSDCGGGSSD